MIQTLSTNINKEHLIGIASKIDAVLPLNRFEDSPNWSSDAINAEKVYKIQRFVQRVVEETGVSIHFEIVNFFKPVKKIFPYKMQLIKINKNIFNTDIIVDKQICQTITPLTNECKTYVIGNNQGDIVIEDLNNDDYAIASYWTEFKDPNYKQWFIGKYLKYYSDNDQL